MRATLLALLATGAAKPDTISLGPVLYKIDFSALKMLPPVFLVSRPKAVSHGMLRKTHCTGDNLIRHGL